MFRKKSASFSAAVCLLLLSALLGSAAARADEDDPPARVARLAYTQGSVGFQPAGTQDWVAAPLNRPLTTGDKLWSDRDGRVELQLDGSLLRLANATAMSFLNLGDHITQIQLTAGSLVVRVRRLDDDETYEVDTPNLAFSILRPGLYRITVDESGQNTAIGIRRGQGEVTGAGSAYAVRANEYDVFSGTSELVEDVHPYGSGADPFDAWSASRDDRWEHSNSARYVSPDVVGYEDLDDEGSWSQTPDYGYVWFPSAVPAEWAPYRDGYWAYIAPWGYTWVDQQRWGFAPFHYGRWIAVRGSWGWVPCPPQHEGTAYVRPVYAPALVAWVGIGAGVAWFALGPREVYVPSYPVSRRYVTAINVSNTTVNTTVVNNVYNTMIINNKPANAANVRYLNRNVPGAVAATTSQAFTTARPVSANRVSLDARAISNAPIRALPPAARPTRQAVLGAARESAVKPPAMVQARPVVARTAAPDARGIQPGAAFRPAVRVAPPATSAAPRSPDNRMPARPAMSTAEPARPAAGAIHPRELPPAPKPPSPAIAESALERQHLQAQQQLQAQQEEERRRVQMQQQQEHEQQAKQQADEARQHQQQTQELAQQHAQQQQQLQEQQQAERQQQESQTKPANRREEHPPGAKP